MRNYRERCAGQTRINNCTDGEKFGRHVSCDLSLLQSHWIKRDKLLARVAHVKHDGNGVSSEKQTLCILHEPPNAISSTRWNMRAHMQHITAETSWLKMHNDFSQRCSLSSTNASARFYLDPVCEITSQLLLREHVAMFNPVNYLHRRS